MAMLRTITVLLLAVLAGQAAVAQEELDPNREIKKYRDPSTTMSEPIYRRLTTIHDNLGEEDYAKALESLRRFRNTAMNDYEEAMVMARQSMASQGEAGFSYEPVIAASLARLGRMDEARDAAKALHARFPNATLEPTRIFAADEVVDHLREGLRLAGLEL